MTNPCAHCGEPFTPHPSDKTELQTHCQKPECRAAFYEIKKARNRKMSMFRCEHCQRPTLMRSGNQKWCKHPMCQKDKRYVDDHNHRRAEREYRKSERKPKKEPKRGHNRKCKYPGCGKYCWPNWFYCKEHHPDISSQHYTGDDYSGGLPGVWT